MNDATPQSGLDDGDQVERLAAFVDADAAVPAGGNPAGVVIRDATPSVEEMQRIAAEIGYSETAFLAPASEPGAWRVRYFAPEMEVPFCGHATIAAGAALGRRFGPGAYPLLLNDGVISVEAFAPAKSAAGGGAGLWRAALQSPKTWSSPVSETLVRDIQALFETPRTGLSPDLARDLAPAVAGAGAKHLILPLATSEALAGLGAPMRYSFDAVQKRMRADGLVTIAFVHRSGPEFLLVRNAFAPGGVVEDPATGAAAAAIAGWLRDIGAAPPSGRFEILQGVEMGAPSRLTVEFDGTAGAPVKVSGHVRDILEPR